MTLKLEPTEYRLIDYLDAIENDLSVAASMVYAARTVVDARQRDVDYERPHEQASGDPVAAVLRESCAKANIAWDALEVFDNLDWHSRFKDGKARVVRHD